MQLPNPSPRDHLEFDGLKLRSNNRVQHAIDFDRSPLNWADHLLQITIGHQRPWGPADYYALLPNGYETDPDRAYAFVGTTKIVFESRFDVDSDQVARATNKPIYTLHRQEQYLVLSKGEDRRWYFESLDGGQSWRLAQIEQIKHPGMFTRLQWINGTVQAFTYPNGSEVRFEYQGNYLALIKTPFGESIHIDRGPGNHITKIEVFRNLQNEPAKPRQSRAVPFATYEYERDVEGRITRYVSPSGRVYTCAYSKTDTTEAGVRLETYSYLVRRQHDGLFRARKDIFKNRQEWIVQTWSGGQDDTPETTESDYWGRMEMINSRWSVISYGKTPTQLRGSHEFDKAGHAVLEADSNEVVAREYNDLGRPTMVRRGDEVERYEYNDFGQITSFVRPDGRSSSSRYDEHARRLEHLAYWGAATIYTYDERGFPETILVNDREYRFEFDNWGRLAHEVEPDGSATTWTYDMLGRLTSVANSEGDQSSSTTSTRSYIYDEQGRLATVVYKDPDMEATQEDRFRYGQDGKLHTWVQRDGRRSTFRYDSRTMWLVQRNTPTVIRESWTYFGNGSIRTRQRTAEGQQSERFEFSSPSGPTNKGK